MKLEFVGLSLSSSYTVSPITSHISPYEFHLRKGIIYAQGILRNMQLILFLPCTQ